MAYHNYHARYKEYKRLWKLKQYCNGDLEKVENYQQAAADGFKGWCIHHRLEFTIDGELAHMSDSLKRLGMYYHRPYFELVFMTVKDHRKLHNADSQRRGTWFKGSTGHTGHKHTEEAKAKMRASHRKRVGGD